MALLKSSMRQIIRKGNTISVDMVTTTPAIPLTEPWAFYGVALIAMATQLIHPLRSAHTGLGMTQSIGSILV